MYELRHSLGGQSSLFLRVSKRRMSLDSKKVKMNSITYLKRQYEISKNVIYLHIAQEIESLERQVETLKEELRKKA